MNTRDLPGSLDFVQCVDGKDTIIQDYAQVDGWQNAEVMDIIAQLEQSITTREIPPVPAVNFHITDDNIGEGGPKQKFARNIAAIETLFKLESENRNATTEEQEILSNYVGWGGLADAFDPDKGNWAKEYQTLKNLLSEDEYAAARASTLNAHYTSPTVIRSIYDAVGQMGFETGNILEPAMGIGNFFGMLPPEMQSSRLYGVELDSITGRIAQKLYPNAEIKVAGFETTDRRDFYDLAVGNVPFGNYKVSDKPYDKLGFSIHNYFFAKALDQVRPGGVVAFVTSRYTMDSKNSDARRYMAQRAELLGAIRLPNDAFKKNAGTEVVSDILFLQKRDHPIDIVPEWVNLDRTEEGHTMNSYFVAHPEMVLGDTVEESTAYGMDITVRPIEGMELSELLKEAVSHIQGTYQAVELPEADKGKEIETIPATPDVKNFSYTVVDGNVYFRENSLMRRVDLNEKAKDRVMGMVELRGIVNELIEYQLEDYPDEMITQKQAELNDAYDAFAAKNGLINNRANGQAFADDSSYYLLCSLENVDEDGNLKSKADMFTKRTIKPERRVTSVDTPSEALAISIGERGKVDLPFMAQLLGTPGEYDAIQAELRGVIFKDPMAPDAVEVGWQTADDYLSGDVRSKLRVAQMAADRDSSFHINVEALQKAQPKDLDASEIDVRLGATWIDADYIQQFMEETFETPYYLRRSIEVKFSELTAEWRINGKSSPNYNDVAAYVTYGTERANAYRILEETLNLKDIRIYDTIEDAEAKKRKLQVEYEQESGTFIPPSAKTVNDLLDEYMSIYGVNTWAMSTYESRKSLIANYIRPLIGDMKLEDVTPRIMDKYYRDLLSVKAVSSKYVKARTEYLTPHTVREVHKTLRNAFNQAVKWELMTRNPVEHATLPKEEHKTRDIWTAEVLQKALEACDDDILRLAINLAFSCSLRMGELLGLTWDCIDISPTSIELGQASIFVEKELQRVNREAMADLDGKDIMFKFPPTFASTHTALVLKTPKTKTSVRKVFLPKTVAEMLVQRKADIEELKDLFGDEFVDFNLVFCSSNGKPIEGQVINRAFNKLIEEKGLPKVVFHSLRHSSITYKLKLNGGDMKSVQGDSGHAQVKMVADVYSHIIDDDRRLNAERMEAAFYSGRQATPEPVQPAATESSADDKELLLKLLQNPEMAALLKSLAKTL